MTAISGVRSGEHGLGRAGWMVLGVLALALMGLVGLLALRAGRQLSTTEQALVGRWFSEIIEDGMRIEVLENYRTDGLGTLHIRAYDREPNVADILLWQRGTVDQFDSRWSFDGTEIHLEIVEQTPPGRVWDSIVSFVRSGRWNRDDDSRLRVLVHELATDEKEVELVGSGVRIHSVRVPPEFVLPDTAISLEEVRRGKAQNPPTSKAGGE